MSTSEELLRQDVLEEYKKGRSVFRVAKALGISLGKVKDLLGEDLPPMKRREALFGGRGRPNMEKYIVMVKSVTEDWDNDTGPVADARAAYEAGTHEMAKGRDGDNEILYLIPRAIPHPRPNYFSTGLAV